MTEAFDYKKHLTYEQYQELEEQTDTRFEYYNGEVFAMSGGTLNHNDIAYNLNAAIKTTFGQRGCRSFQENVKLEVAAGSYYVYPDVILTCHPDDVKADSLIKSPVLIAEVLSRSTEQYNRGFKWKKYQRIPSLKYYLLVDQETVFIEVFSRQGNSDLFSYQSFSSLDEIILFQEIDFSLPVSSVYNGITLREETAE